MTHLYKYKHLLFYSNRDQGSLTFLKELTERPMLDQQFVKICVNDPQVKIPDCIIANNRVPVVVCQGFDKLISGEDALSWLRNNAFSEKSNGTHEFGNLDQFGKMSSEFSQLLQEFQPTEYNQFHNSDWNLGFDRSKAQMTTRFSNMNDQHRIETYEMEGKENRGEMINRRFELLKQQRDEEALRGSRNSNGFDSRVGASDRNSGQRASGMTMTGGGNSVQSMSQGGDSGPSGAGQGSAFGSDLNSAYQPIIGPGEPAKDNGPRISGPPTYNPNVYAPTGQQALPSGNMPSLPTNRPMMPTGYGPTPQTVPNLPAMPAPNFYQPPGYGQQQMLNRALNNASFPGAYPGMYPTMMMPPGSGQLPNMPNMSPQMYQQMLAQAPGRMGLATMPSAPNAPNAPNPYGGYVPGTPPLRQPPMRDSGVPGNSPVSLRGMGQNPRMPPTSPGGVAPYGSLMNQNYSGVPQPMGAGGSDNHYPF